MHRTARFLRRRGTVRSTSPDRPLAEGGPAHATRDHSPRTHRCITPVTMGLQIASPTSARAQAERLGLVVVVEAPSSLPDPCSPYCSTNLNEEVPLAPFSAQIRSV